MLEVNHALIFEKDELKDEAQEMQKLVPTSHLLRRESVLSKHFGSDQCSLHQCRFCAAAVAASALQSARVNAPCSGHLARGGPARLQTLKVIEQLNRVDAPCSGHSERGGSAKLQSA